MSDPPMSEPRTTITEFARHIQQEDAKTRAAEIGLRALHAELVEERSPQRVITQRAREAQERGDQVAARRRLEAREGPRTARTRGPWRPLGRPEPRSPRGRT